MGISDGHRVTDEYGDESTASEEWRIVNEAPQPPVGSRRLGPDDRRDIVVAERGYDQSTVAWAVSPTHRVLVSGAAALVSPTLLEFAAQLVPTASEHRVEARLVGTMAPPPESTARTPAVMLVGRNGDSPCVILLGLNHDASCTRELWDGPLWLEFVGMPENRSKAVSVVAGVAPEGTRERSPSPTGPPAPGTRSPSLASLNRCSSSVPPRRTSTSWSRVAPVTRSSPTYHR